MAKAVRSPRPRRQVHANVLVIGLGRFGKAIARELMRNGHEVLGVDTDERIVQQMSAELTQCVMADTTQDSVLKELSVQDFDSAVVAIGADIEASILTASLLLQNGLENVWAKSNSEPHGRILKQLGVKNVVFPEKDMGHRVAHMVSGESLDYVPIDEDFVMVKAEAPEAFNGKNLADLKIRSTHGVTVVATSKGDGQYQPAFPDTIIETGDVLVVAGQTRQVDKFCSIA